jgi:hypothetical protein
VAVKTVSKGVHKNCETVHAPSMSPANGEMCFLLCPPDAHRTLGQDSSVKHELCDLEQGPSLFPALAQFTHMKSGTDHSKSTGLPEKIQGTVQQGYP